MIMRSCRYLGKKRNYGLDFGEEGFLNEIDCFRFGFVEKVFHEEYNVIRCFSIWPCTSISINSVSVISMFRTFSYTIFRSEELTRFWSKSRLSWFQKAYALQRSTRSFGIKMVQFKTRIWSEGISAKANVWTKIWGDGKYTRSDRSSSDIF